MTNRYLSPSILLAACLVAPVLQAQSVLDTFTVKVVGVTSDKDRGDKSPAKRHQSCGNDFRGSHWCSTQEYLAGGMEMDADKKLDTAWIRPTIVSTEYTSSGEVVYIDASGGTIKVKQLNCRQWASEEASDSGPVLQKATDDQNQIVTLEQCSEKLPNLCCAPVADN